MLLCPYWLVTLHVTPLESSNKMGEMVKTPSSLTLNLLGGRGAPVVELQLISPLGKLSGVEQVRLAVVLVGKTVGWMEVATGGPEQSGKKEM